MTKVSFYLAVFLFAVKLGSVACFSTTGVHEGRRIRLVDFFTLDSFDFDLRWSLGVSLCRPSGMFFVV